MPFGKPVGYALLGLVDALVPTAVAVAVVFQLWSWVTGYPRLELVLAVAGLGLAAGFVLGALAAVRGGEPFPVTRAAVALWKRYLWYI
ncbi:hypothetical protein SAMN05216388_1002193 [Halorientalis persicus]|jgi:ribose/xylose/arabinose/galactoside ABC-type transport system permease subunit|uniref:Uncharacterized protein n=1 Tax=Halorientalis persicus TaxID=1367881 RepID=A0A1H8F4P8_9EURY|nr:hypothetical protein [Halorientalis persicus]SEN26665.1 hypothetical protein SAMN05216388_1002193 [Halorientalis persicus]